MKPVKSAEDACLGRSVGSRVLLAALQVLVQRGEVARAPFKFNGCDVRSIHAYHRATRSRPGLNPAWATQVNDDGVPGYCPAEGSP